jgi:hypothetical protein
MKSKFDLMLYIYSKILRAFRQILLRTQKAALKSKGAHVDPLKNTIILKLSLSSRVCMFA